MKPDINLYRLQSGYASEYGTFIGLAWIAVFALFIVSLRTLNSGIMTLAMLAYIALSALPLFFGHRFRKMMPEDTKIGFGRAYWLALMMLIYSSLLTAGAEFAYFKWMDNGAVITAMYELVNSPIAVQTYSDMGMSDTLTILKSTMNDLSQLTAFDTAVSLFNQNVFFSLLLALPTAFLIRKQ